MDVYSLASHPPVAAARARVRELEAETLREQLEIVTIPAPSFGEGPRADYVERRFRELGLAGVHRDDAGNVLGRVGASDTHAGAVVAAAHLDTVFPAETDLTPRRVGQRIYAPGITDNARGVAALLTLARVCLECGVPLARPLYLAATVGEEGIGDLRGVKHLFASGARLASASAFISLDGSGLRRIVHRAIGSRRFRVTLTGPGGHSWSDWGAPNPAHALGAVIAALRELPLPDSPTTTLTVARLGAGTAINVIPGEAWLELDLRSEGVEVLGRLEQRCREVVEEHVRRENERRRRGTAPLSARIETIGDRPAGQLDPEHPLVRNAVDATELLGAQPQLVASSTDANVPLSHGIPAIALGAGGASGGVHTPDEWYEDRAGARGVERALLVMLARCALPRG